MDYQASQKSISASKGINSLERADRVKDLVFSGDWDKISSQDVMHGFGWANCEKIVTGAGEAFKDLYFSTHPFVESFTEANKSIITTYFNIVLGPKLTLEDCL